MNSTNKIDNQNITEMGVPIFAATTAAASYKFGDEGFVDIMFIRPKFVIGDTIQDTRGLPPGAESRAAIMEFQTVSAITLTATQTKQMIDTLQDQLDKLEKM
ncbi:hypothetical protein ACI2JB_01405 [Pantoea agglomerans]|uniref:hypothetical protein n=1 Tax=Enterobacter agglomerans TaxID=549 RepID=UPI00384F96ED